MTFLHSGYNSKINLSAKQMRAISQEISREFTPCFFNQMPMLDEKIRLTSRELLDIGEEIRRDFAPKVSFDTSELILLPVGPGHLYVYWSIPESNEAEVIVNDGKEHLTLRIYGQADEPNQSSEIERLIDIQIDSPHSRQQVFLPVVDAETAYTAEIGKYDDVDDKFVVLAHSNIIHATRGSATWYQIHEDIDVCLAKHASGQGIGKQAQ